MIRQSFAAIGRAFRDLVLSPGAIVVFVPLYLLLLVTFYVFISTGVGSAIQVVISGMTVVAIPILFYLFQSASGYWGIGEKSIGRLLVGALKGFLKYVLISIPLFGLVVLFAWLVHKLQVHYSITEATTTRVFSGGRGNNITKLSWIGVLTYSVELFVLAFVAPLITIHFWLALARTTLLRTILKTFRILVRALSGSSLLIYSIGLVFFGLIPYFLLFTRTSVKNGWLELSIFGIRLLLAFLFTLVGWLVTLRALGTLPIELEGVRVPVPARNPIEDHAAVAA